MYAGAERWSSEVASVRMHNRITWNDKSAIDLGIDSVDGQPTSEGQSRLARVVTVGVDEVELVPGERRLVVGAFDAIEPRLRRSLRFTVAPGASYTLETRASDRQPPIEVFAFRDDTREEIAVSWIAPPESAAFGLDPTRWTVADWRVEDASHWIRFEPANPGGGGNRSGADSGDSAARERLRLEWSELDRFESAPTAAWSHGVDLRREIEAGFNDFEWTEHAVGDTTGVYTWSGRREGRTERLHGLVVLRVRDGRTAVLRYTNDSAERFAREQATWREWGLAEGWVLAWEEALP